MHVGDSKADRSQKTSGNFGILAYIQASVSEHDAEYKMQKNIIYTM